MTVLLTVAAGMLIGLSLGALGGGGSILTVPVLVYLLGQSAAAATQARSSSPRWLAESSALAWRRESRQPPVISPIV
ncbi:hypothetical protein AB0I34_40495 [Kribbella sp. NPDC050281]|uniref:hypothetical protein n=1 Tax=Kribbella sp. NPDC050281 TaxID=3155515 RepID=UPI0033EAB26B